MVVLHGYDDAPEPMLDVGAALDRPGTAVLAVPSGPTTTPGGGPGWFPSHEGDRGPALREALGALDELIELLAAEHDVDPAATVLAGYSQGAATAAALMLHRASTTTVARFVGWATFLPDDPEVVFDPARGGRAFLAHGTDDEVVPPVAGRSVARLLERHGHDVTWLERPGGHALTDDLVGAAATWLGDEGSGPDVGDNGRP